MPRLFISYKRGTQVGPLMDHLKAAKYWLWYDKDDIHAGENWRESIDRGVDHCDAVIVALTPAACASEYVQYEVARALRQHKLIFPVKLEAIDESKDPAKLGIPDLQFIDLTTPGSDAWEVAFKRLLADMVRHEPLRITRHTLRQMRDEPTYALHQQYLATVIESVGSLSLAQITPDQAEGVPLEQVYVDSPTHLSLSVEVKNWKIIDWWLTNTSDDRVDAEGFARLKPSELGYEPAALEALLPGIEGQIEAYAARPENYRFYNRWKDGPHERVLGLAVQDVAAARDRLVILGGPGSGKSTFVRHLALCLAGAGRADWDRAANLDSLGAWPHGPLTPIYLELRRFVASGHFPAIPARPTADHLWAYIEAEILTGDLKAYLPELKADMAEGRAVLILDGLDEVPYPVGQLNERQKQLQALAESLNGRYPRARLIVASRPHAYEGWKLPGFEAVTIADFEDQHRIELARRLYTVGGLGSEAAAEKADGLNQALGPVHPELKDRPLFVTLMATLFLKGEAKGLPTRRGALYRQSIELLLERWTKAKPGLPTLPALLGAASTHDLYDRLAALAYDVHGQFGEQSGAPEIPTMLLESQLFKLARNKGSDAVGLFNYLSQNAGVLVSPGQDDERDVFRFAHRSFQEYLAASHLAGLCHKADSFQTLRQHIQGKPQLWREPACLVGDVLADSGRAGDLWDLIDDLLDDPPAPTEVIESGDPRWWAVWLSSAIVLEQGLMGEGLRRRDRQVCDTLAAWLVRLTETAGALLPPERAAAGRALSRLDDPRPGVGLRPDGLPDIRWADSVEAGDYAISEPAQSDNPPRQVTIPAAFRVSLYPVTQKQYLAFQQDASLRGYACPDWWAGLAAGDEDKRPAEPGFAFDNHPMEQVNWYQAMAFCRWLTERYRAAGLIGADQIIRLPREQEWEAAARGRDGRTYSYAGAFDATKANTRESGIGQTSAVGLFPAGRSPYGVEEMSGNVWEWCLSDRANPQMRAEDEDLRISASRTLRGGSWFNAQDSARAAFRIFPTPYYRSNSVGFRVVAGSVPPSP